MPAVAMKVNGSQVSGDVEGRTLLVDYLRNQLGLTGTHVGCDTSQCGACTVLLDGGRSSPARCWRSACDGADVTTIEGLAKNGKLHPMQEAFREHHGLQCGFCTPGMIMAAVDIVKPQGQVAVRGDGAPRARGQYLPLHRLPQYRQGHSGRRFAHVAKARCRSKE